jgi:regulatory protein
MRGDKAVQLEYAKTIALRMLASRDHSREEIRNKLGKKGISLEEIETVIHDLEKQKFINDARYAERLALYFAKEKNQSSPWILTKLLQKGIPEDLAQEVVEKTEKTFSLHDRLCNLMQKKLADRSSKQISLKEKSQIARSLRQSGFDWEAIQEMFKEIGGFPEEC